MDTFSKSRILELIVVEFVPCLSTDTFSCHKVLGSESRCIKSQYVCDGINQCWDKNEGTDEDMCGKNLVKLSISMCVKMWGLSKRLTDCIKGLPF